MCSSDLVSESSVSREHRIILGHDGLLTIAGGKLTTYRRMARQIVDNVVQMLRLADSLPETLSEARTDQVPLPGGRFWPADDLVGIAVKCFERAGGTIDERRAGFLATTYGTLSDSLAELLRENPELAQPLAPQRPELLVQVDWAVRRELAATLGDVMVRRTQLFFRDPDQGLGIAPTVAARMSALLGWSRDREHDELARYRDEVGRSRAWREG